MPQKVYLKNLNGTEVYSDTVELVSHNDKFLTTKAAAPGRWYYEFTHHNGSNTHMIGFMIGNSNSNSFHIMPRGSSDVFYLHYYDGIEAFSTSNGTKLEVFSSMEFDNVQNNHTVGVAFDSYSRIFSLFYEQQAKHFFISTATKGEKVTPCFLEGTPTFGSEIIYRDFVSLKFNGDFYYNVPYGYTPWGLPYKPCTCEIKKTINFHQCFILIALYIDFD